MNLLSQLTAWALKIKYQTEDRGNTEKLVGGLFEGIIEQLKKIETKIANVIIGWIWQEPVNTLPDLYTKYPNPKIGYTVLVKKIDNYPRGAIHIWNGLVWVNTGFTGVPNDVALSGGSDKTLKEVEDYKADRFKQNTSIMYNSDILEGIANLYNHLDVDTVVGKYLNKENGNTILDNEEYTTTGFINIQGLSRIYAGDSKGTVEGIYTYIRFICYYDVSKNFISSQESVFYATRPNNAIYTRISYKHTEIAPEDYRVQANLEIVDAKLKITALPSEFTTILSRSTKNLLNRLNSLTREGYYLSLIGNLIKSDKYIVTPPIPLIAGQTLASKNLIKGGAFHIFMDDRFNIIQVLSAQSVEGTLTGMAGCSYVRLSLNNTPSIQIEYSNTPSEYEPYYRLDSDLVSVKEDNTNFFITNPYKESEAVVGKYLSLTSGLPSMANAIYTTTGFITVEVDKPLYHGNDGKPLDRFRFLGLYNESNEKVDVLEWIDNGYIIPKDKGIVYIRISFLNENTKYQVQQFPVTEYLGVYDYKLNPRYLIETGGEDPEPPIPATSDNDIVLPSKLYLLSGVQNDLFFQPFTKRWKPNDWHVRMTSTGFSLIRHLRHVATTTNPANGIFKVDLYNDVDFSILKTETIETIVGTRSTGSNEVILAMIGDSFINGAFHKHALIDSGFCPNLKIIGLRKTTGTTQHDEGRGGWTLAQYFSTNSSSATVFNPFYQPQDNYRYWGSTAFWIDAWKVFKGIAGAGFEPAYSCGRYDDFLDRFDETTGVLVNSVNGDIQYNSTFGKYQMYNGSTWVDTPALTWTFQYGKYLSMWNMPTPQFLFVMLGLNDFRNLNFPADYATWNMRIKLVKDSYLQANPNGMFILGIPCSSVGSDTDSDGLAFTAKQNAAMWEFRKNVIDNFDNVTGFNLVDIGITIDNEFGYNLSTNIMLTTPYYNYEGDEKLKVQNGNPHPYPNYPAMGLPLAGFIQKYRL